MNGSGRRSDRKLAKVQVSSRRPSDLPYATTMHDLSRHGCKIDICEQLETGQLIWVTLPGLAPLQAKVCWADVWKAGLEFERPIHESVFDHLARKIAA